MTIPSEQGNRPRWSGAGFEIWFFVVLIPGESRALWIRLTRFADRGESDARVWAVVFEDGKVAAAEREILPVEAMTTEAECGGMHVRVGEAELGHGFSRGRCGSIRWEFEYEATDPLVERLPKLPRFVPLRTHSTHPHAEAHVTGFVELDGRRIELDGGMFTQMHIWGTERVEWLRWAWAPRFEHVDAELELTAVAPKVGGPNLCALWARIGDELFDHSGLTKSTLASVQSMRAGVLHHVANSGGRRLVVRVWGPPESFAGWDYRKIGGGDLHVAQSDLVRCELELYRRAGLGWRPETRVLSTCGALEFHGPDNLAEFTYLPWDGPSAQAHPSDTRVETTAPIEATPPGPGAWIDTPKPARIVALGLTYKAHAKETASGSDPVVFEIDPAAWTVGDGEILRPSTEELFAALASLDPALPATMAKHEFGFVPAMLDYEVELGLVLLDGLDDPSAPGRVGLCVANDVSARTLQILGEGQANRLDYWTAAKSFPGFAPTTARAWIPERFELDAWPKLTLETRVNGAVRQSSALSLLSETPRQMLARVRESAGPLAPNTLLLTGTPAGVAFFVPRWKRAMGERLLDRLGRLRAALGGFCGGTAFLRPGDRVEVSAGFLGGFARVVNVGEQA